MSRAANSPCNLRDISGLSAFLSVGVFSFSWQGPLSWRQALACSYAYHRAPERPWECCSDNTPDACNCPLQRTREGLSDGKPIRSRSSATDHASRSGQPPQKRPSTHARVSAISTPRHAHARELSPIAQQLGQHVTAPHVLPGARGGSGGPAYLATDLAAHSLLHMRPEVRAFLDPALHEECA